MEHFTDFTSVSKFEDITATLPSIIAQTLRLENFKNKRKCHPNAFPEMKLPSYV